MSSGENTSLIANMKKDGYKDKWWGYATQRKYSQFFAIATIFSGALGLLGLSLAFRFATSGLTDSIENSTDKSDGGKVAFDGWFYSSLAFALVQMVQLFIDVTWISRRERQLHIMMANGTTKQTAQNKWKRSIRWFFVVFGVVHTLSVVPHLGNLSYSVILLQKTAKDAAVGFAAGNIYFSALMVVGSIFIAFKYWNTLGYFEKAASYDTKTTNPLANTQGLSASAQASQAPYVAGKMY
jgi:hypothetical protein